MANSKEKISPDSKRAWLMLAIIAFSVFSNSGLQLSFGTILGALVNEFGESKSKTAWVGTLVSFFSMALSPVTILLANRHGIHVTQFLGGVFLTVGAVTTSMMNTINYMYLTYGVLLGISGALIYAPAFATIPELFTKYVSIATGLTSAGSMIGLIFFSSILPMLLEEFGWNKALWCVAGFGPLISATALILSRNIITTRDACEEKKEKVDLEVQVPWWKSVKKKAYVLFTISSVLFALVELVPIFIMPICATESGIPLAKTNWLNIAYGFGSLMGRIISGPITQPLFRRDKSKYLYLTCLILYSLFSFLVSMTIKFEYLLSYMIVVGLINGVMAGLFFLVTLEVVGFQSYATTCGLNLAVCGLAYTIGAPLAGILYESFNSIQCLLLAVAGTTLLSGIFAALTPYVTPHGTYKLHQSDYDFWRVYCNSPNIKKRSPRQDRAFTIASLADEFHAQDNLAYQPETLSESKHTSNSVSVQLAG